MRIDNLINEMNHIQGVQCYFFKYVEVDSQLERVK